MKTTTIGSSYYNNQGAYQTEYSELYDKYVPTQGSAETLNGELIRAISRLAHDYYNNGNGNAAEQVWGNESYTCSGCGGTGRTCSYDNDSDEFDEPECDECGGSGEEYEEVIQEIKVGGMFQSFLDLIEQNVPEAKEAVSEVEALILTEFYLTDDQFSDKNKQVYNTLFDIVIHYVLNNEDKPLSEDYENK